MKWTLKRLHQSYPMPETGKSSIAIALIFGLFITVFLIFFKPFDLNLSYLPYNNWKIAFFGVITTVVCLLIHNILPFLLPKGFVENNWTVKHQIIFYLLLLFCIATANGLYINYLFSLSFKWFNYGSILLQTLGLGSIPIVIYTLFNYNKQLKQHLEAAHQITEQIDKQKAVKESSIFKITTQLKNDSFTIDERSFLFAQADGNYTHIRCLSGKKTLHRITISSLTTQLNSDYLTRCHRSFLVNLKHVEKIEGNAQGLKLWLTKVGEPIPVSRKYVQSIKSYFQKAH